ncbi:uncharacterized protein LOC125855902 [Solanum stenotomum]|uniref:uncharacterized protein LOC125855902 n=1 Tax=Solanum stenotomum TaxID=172797 RepID=UPI0020D15D5C|nr:uncharacterized protein LOC125855902 [Solanum stenotomum]
MNDEAEKNRASVDTSLVVDVESMEAGHTQSASAAMIYKMGNLSHSVDVRASRVEFLWGGVDIAENPSSKMPTIPATTGVATVDEDGESDIPETNEEELEACEDVVYKDLEDLESEFLWVATKASIHDTLIFR